MTLLSSLASSTGGFGSPPTFGSSSAFGSPPSFGGGATFGSSSFSSPFGSGATTRGTDSAGTGGGFGGWVVGLYGVCIIFDSSPNFLVHLGTTEGTDSASTGGGEFAG